MEIKLTKLILADNTFVLVLEGLEFLIELLFLALLPDGVTLFFDLIQEPFLLIVGEFKRGHVLRSLHFLLLFLFGSELLCGDLVFGAVG